MASDTSHDAWNAGESYELYMGRWSRQIAREFVPWLNQKAGLDWLDIGCGTGALTQTILELASPRSVLAIDPSDGFVSHARTSTFDDRATFAAGSAQDLPAKTASIDVAASALAYNFFPDRPAALAEIQRVMRPGGTIGLYVWDYPGGGMGFMHAFWDAAVLLDPEVAGLVESARFPFCTRETLTAEFSVAGLSHIDVRPIEVPASFESFDDFWRPFTLGAGPAPGYCMSLPADARETLRESLHSTLGRGPIEFPARAWAIRANTQLP